MSRKGVIVLAAVLTALAVIGNVYVVISKARASSELVNPTNGRRNVLAAIDINNAAATTPAREAFGEDRADPFMFFSDASWPSGPLSIPPDIGALFPSDLSNTTELRNPPGADDYCYRRFRDILTDKNLDVIKLMGRWSDTSQPFLSEEVNKLHLKLFYPYIPRVCMKDPPPFPSRQYRRNVECHKGPPRELTPFEREGNHILFTIRTTVSLHSERLPILFLTWLTNVNRSNVVIVTDAVDPILQYRTSEAGLKLRLSVAGYERLCEKAGDEVSLIFLPENSHYEWFCHIDDDMYVNVDRLVDVLAFFKRDELVYFGRAGSRPAKSRLVLPESKLGDPGTPYDFATGGTYCLNRAFLNKARRWIGTRKAFSTMCNLIKEPEDVTVGFVAGVVLGLRLNQTGLIHTHGANLYTVNSNTLEYQVSISYGYGKVHWGRRPNNNILIPHNLFSISEDPSQFLSLHCHYYPHIGWCINQQNGPGLI